jgi:hypothetical protein
MNISHINNPESLNKSVVTNDVRGNRKRKDINSSKKNLNNDYSKISEPMPLRESPLKVTFNPRFAQTGAEEPYSRPVTSHFGGGDD